MRWLLSTLVIAACVPDAELWDERPATEAILSMARPARPVALVDPPPGSVVPRNLAALVVRFPGAPRVLAAGAGLRLRQSRGPAIDLGVPESVPCPGPYGMCYGLALVGLLPPNAGMILELAGGAALEDGSAIEPQVVGGFATAAEADHAAPEISEVRVEPVAGCLRVRLRTDEPVTAIVVARGAGAEAVFALPRAAVSADIAFRIAGVFPVGEGAEILARARDFAGNRSESEPVRFRVPAPPPAVAITEVLANPAGPETTQEFVEVKNLGTEPFGMEALVLEDAAGRDPLPTGELPPGAYALVVPQGYDPHEGRDPAPRPGTVLLRVAGRLGLDGLGNGGEAVRLRLAGGEPVSSYGGWVDASAGAYSGKSVHRVPEDACDHMGDWSTQPPTPGY